jgi:hypothetical protein
MTPKKLQAQLKSMENPLDPVGTQNRQATWLLYHQKREAFIGALYRQEMSKADRMREITNFDSKYRRLW